MTEKLNKNKQKKASIINEISQKLSKAKALVFTNYQGLTHKQIEQFKIGLRTIEAEYAITKNTLLKRALKEKNHPFDDKKLDHPTATLFLYGDPIMPLKALAKMLKDIQKPEIKFGIMDGNIVDQQQVLRLATLPSKDILRVQLVANLQSPLSGFHRSLLWNLQKFVITLKSVESKKVSAQN